MAQLFSRYESGLQFTAGAITGSVNGVSGLNPIVDRLNSVTDTDNVITAGSIANTGSLRIEATLANTIIGGSKMNIYVNTQRPVVIGTGAFTGVGGSSLIVQGAGFVQSSLTVNGTIVTSGNVVSGANTLYYLSGGRLDQLIETTSSNQNFTSSNQSSGNAFTIISSGSPSISLTPVKNGHMLITYNVNADVNSPGTTDLQFESKLIVNGSDSQIVRTYGIAEGATDLVWPHSMTIVKTITSGTAYNIGVFARNNNANNNSDWEEGHLTATIL